MSQETTDLKTEIRNMKSQNENTKKVPMVKGYSIALSMMTDLVCCILVGLALGLFFQKFFHTPPLLTAALTLLGGIAGLYTTIRFAINKDKK